MKRDIIVMFITLMVIVCYLALKNSEWYMLQVATIALCGWGWMYFDESRKAKIKEKDLMRIEKV